MNTAFRHHLNPLKTPRKKAIEAYFVTTSVCAFLALTGLREFPQASRALCTCTRMRARPVMGVQVAQVALRVTPRPSWGLVDWLRKADIPNGRAR